MNTKSVSVRTHPWFISLFVLFRCTSLLHGEIATIEIDPKEHGPEINPKMYGVFLEEINTAVDGGLYAELVRNRGFEDAKAPEGFSLINGKWNNGRGYIIPYRFEVDQSLPYWSIIKEGDARGTAALDLTNPLTPATPRSCRVTIEGVSQGRLGIANEGFWGISVTNGEKYRLALWARADGRFAAPVEISLETADGKSLSRPAAIKRIGSDWKQFRAELTATGTDPRARLVLAARAPGTLWFDMVSLFPAKTFRNRQNGLRPDIAQLIADLKPGFVRFPGGCVVEGATPENAYDWKQSIGPLERRPEIWNVWDYRRTHGMGMFEYLQYCEDIGAEPMYVGFAGQTCIYRHGTNVPLAEMGPIETNFLDALEFANGPANSTWGKLRAAAGHKKPFNLNLVEIGNENVGREYEVRYARIYPKIKSRYPHVTALANFPQDQAPTEMVDEHYYNNPSWFINNFHRYDKRDRHEPPVYIAEVAVTSAEGGRDKGNLVSALSEGVFLMGAERNGDVVRMVSYAPLLANVHGRTELAGAPPPWHGMIYFDSSRAFGTASYYLWKSFAENLPNRTVKTDVSIPSAAHFKIVGRIGVGTWDTSAEFKDVRVEQNGNVLYASDFTTDANGWEPVTRRGTASWQANGGVYRQDRPGRATSYYGNTNWSDYAMSLKAQKLAGGEGFLILFGAQDGGTYWWNLGGWGNTRHSIEHSVRGTQMPIGESVPGHLETNRWYDIRIELSGDRVRCYLDNTLIHDETITAPPTFFAVAGQDDASNEIVLKVVNIDSAPRDAVIQVNDPAPLTGQARLTLLTAASVSDNNSLEDPRRVVPSNRTIDINAQQFRHTFPANSLSILRFADNACCPAPAN